MSSINSKTYEASTPTKVAFLGLGVMGYPMACLQGYAGHR
ncbi:MAG TPA: oxidoreductase, partial [Burkholderiaceae bacterium]|nr:oxidoreductase [Burkholderiaceae bacterium]